MQIPICDLQLETQPSALLYLNCKLAIANCKSPKMQRAHEAARDAAPGAFCVFGPILEAISLPAWARLGPLSRERLRTNRSAPTVDRDCFRRDRSPNGAAWRFPDWTAVGFRLGNHQASPRAQPVKAKTRTAARQPPVPEPMPRIGLARLAVTGQASSPWAQRAADRGTLSPRCGAPLAATLTRIAPCRVFSANELRVATSLAAGFLRARFGSFARIHSDRSRLRIRSVLRFRRSLSCPTTSGNVRKFCRLTKGILKVAFKLSTRFCKA